MQEIPLDKHKFLRRMFVLDDVAKSEGIIIGWYGDELYAFPLLTQIVIFRRITVDELNSVKFV